MNNIFTILLILFVTIKGYSGGATCTGTANDNCIDAITLTIDGTCVDGCTVDNTTEGGEVFDCNSSIDASIWYDFVATSTSHQINIWEDATGGCFFGSAVYSGGCVPTTPISCHDIGNGPIDQAHLLTGLTIGNTYLIQIVYDDFGPCGDGADVCVEVISYDPCDLTICSDICYPVCEWTTPPTTAQVTSTCTSSVYDPPMHERSRKECWTFTGNSSSVTFSAIVSSNCGGGQFTFLEWELFDNTCTSIEGPTDIFTDATATTVSGNNYTVCYDMVFAECNITQVYPYVIVGGVLPIELLSFKGELIDDYVKLTWVTVSETNNDYFTLEKSKNGIIFDKVVDTIGAGNSNETLKYSYIDEEPYEGLSYYRLKQTDYDGQHSYSKLIYILIEKENSNYQYIDIMGRVRTEKWEELSRGVYIIWNGQNYKKVLKY